MIATDHSKIKVFNVIMVLALAFALVAGAIAVKTSSVSAVNNIPPVAEAGPDQAVQSISTTVHTGGFPNVQLDGSLSFDPRGDTITYSWTMGSLSNVPAYTALNGWPGAGSGASITNPTSATPILNLSAATAGIFVVKLTVTDNGTSPNNLTAVDYVVVVAGNTWFVSLHGDNAWNGQVPSYDQGTIGPWRQITFAINNALVKHGDRIMVGENDSDGSQNDSPHDPATPAYAVSGFGGNDAANYERIDINKWLTVWSTNGRNDQGESQGTYATTINVSDQEVNSGSYVVDQVVKITWPFGQSTFTTTGINAEKCGVVFGSDNHGFDLIGAPIGINAIGADAVYIHQNRVTELTVAVPATPDYNFWGIKITDSKAPVVDDNIIDFDGNDADASITGIELIDCDETLPGVLWYNAVPNGSGLVVGIYNGKNESDPLYPYTYTGFGGAQVIHNVVILLQQDQINGIILTNCPKAYVYSNSVFNTVKESADVYSIGIGLFGTDEDACDWSVVDHNIVIVDVDSKTSAVGKGIVIDTCDFVIVSFNNIQVQVTGESPSSMGGLLGIGIEVLGSLSCQVLNNTVNVNNVVSSLTENLGAVKIAAAGNGINDLTSDGLTDLQSAMDDIFSSNYSPTVKYAASLAVGVYGYMSSNIHVGSVTLSGSTGNLIDVCSRVTLLAANFEDDAVPGTNDTLRCAGASLAQGVTVLECNGAVVAMNQIVPLPHSNATTWAATTAKTVGAIVQATSDSVPDYKFNYQCTVAGTTGATEPIWPTTLETGLNTVTDGTVTWKCISGTFEPDADNVGVHSWVNFVVNKFVPSSATPTPIPDKALPNGVGKSGAIGVLGFNCDAYAASQYVNGSPMMVLYNTISVLGDAYLELTGAEVEVSVVDGASSVIGQLETAIEDMASAAGQIASSDDVNLYSLALPPFGGSAPVGVSAFDPDAFTKCRGLVFGIGIATLESTAAVISGNTIVSADSVLDGIVISETGSSTVLPMANGDAVVASSLYNLALSIGILNYMCGITYPGYGVAPTTISKNLCIANADADIYVEAAQIVANHDGGGDAEAHGSGLSVGIGILVIGLENLFNQATIAQYHSLGRALPSDANVTNNSASGNGLICVTTEGFNLVDEQLASADAMAVGVGNGIVVIGQMFPVIEGNGDRTDAYVTGNTLSPDANFVNGYGEACTHIDAVGLSAEDPDADGVSMAVGVGIAAVFCLYPQISNNMNFHKDVYPTPGGDPVVDGSETTPYNPETDYFISGDALAQGYVNATDQSMLVGGSSTSGMGFTYAAGVGILVADCEGAFVSQNHAQGTSHAVVSVISIEEDPMELVESIAYGLSLACGIIVCDILLQVDAGDVELHMPYNIKESNTFEAGAIIDIPACTAIGDPLSAPLGLAAAIDALIIVNNDTVFDPITVDTWATLTSYVLGDLVQPTTPNGFNYECTTAGTSAVNEPNASNLVPNAWPTEAGLTVLDGTVIWTCVDVEYPTEDFNIQPVRFNYNDMPGLIRSSATDGHVLYTTPWCYWVDLGMLVINLNDTEIERVDEDVDLLLVDARYNYWGNPLVPTNYKVASTFNLTGPGGIGVGLGQPIYVVREPWTTWVVYQPWLTINHEWCLDAHVGKFGKSILLNKCWNTFSVPIKLDDVAFAPYYDDNPDTAGVDESDLHVTYNTWAGFKLLNNSFEPFISTIGPAVRWDTVNNTWVNLTQWYALEPLMGFKLYVKNPTAVIILASTADSMPTLPVYDGWNLVGPNPPFCDPGMYVDDFVSSVARTGGIGLPGYGSFSQVVSQGASQHNWSYTLGDWIQYYSYAPFMQVGKAYWLYMNGDATLAGFGFTRLPLYPEHFFH